MICVKIGYKLIFGGVMSYSRWGDSNWYIFWSGSENEGEETINTQQLSIWYAGSSFNPDFLYPEVVFMYETQNWSKLAPDMDIDEVDVLNRCVKQWIDDMKSE